MKPSLEMLIQAAEYLERKDREMEHGYASTLPMPDDYNIYSSGSSSSLSSSPTSSSNKLHRKMKNKTKLHNSRTTHNELEKNRRAHLRTCLEKLKELVPVGPDGSKHTTLGLLKRARYFIKNLEDKDQKQLSQRNYLEKERRHLRRQLEMKSSEDIHITFKRRSVSESSTFSTDSLSSRSSYSESDEVDILGYGSNQSDTDDQSSIESSSSEQGVIRSTRRLTIDESTTYSHL